jgi:hypothetical protein
LRFSPPGYRRVKGRAARLWRGSRPSRRSRRVRAERPLSSPDRRVRAERRLRSWASREARTEARDQEPRRRGAGRGSRRPDGGPDPYPPSTPASAAGPNRPRPALPSLFRVRRGQHERAQTPPRARGATARVVSHRHSGAPQASSEPYTPADQNRSPQPTPPVQAPRVWVFTPLARPFGSGSTLRIAPEGRRRPGVDCG